jgi:hypothetical protein
MVMRELFGDILNIDGVKGLILLSFRGDIIFRELNHIVHENVENRDWRLLIDSLANIRETDLIFEKGRLYIRRTELGFLVVLMGSFVPIAMMRLQCDILLPSLKPAKAAKGIRRLFKK